MIPRRDMAFLACANSDALSRGFGLELGSVLRSPVALDFLDAFGATEAQRQARASLAAHFRAFGVVERSALDLRVVHLAENLHLDLLAGPGHLRGNVTERHRLAQVMRVSSG